MKEPTVTIVVPTYRRLAYLQEALPTALNQSYRDFELIVSDDGDSDEVKSYVESLGDSRVRYRRNARPLGIAMNNFAAFSEARGKYIASLHDDDLWEPEFLEAMVPVLEADETISVAFCDHHIVNKDGRLLSGLTEETSRFFGRDRLQPGRHQPFIRPAVVDHVIPMVMAAVFRKSILAGTEYPAQIGGNYDHWLAYLAVRDGQACFYDPQRLTRYRDHPGSGTSGRRIRNFLESVFVRRRMLQDGRLAECRAAMRNGLGVIYGKMALYYLARRSFRRGSLFLRQALLLMNRPKNILSLAGHTLFALCGRNRGG